MSGDGFKHAQHVLRQRGLRGIARGAADEVRARFEEGHCRLRGQQTFAIDGVRYPQLVHRYNRTWRNERAVEIPLAIDFLSQREGPVLEIGNVLTNYGPTGHVVVDKYERQPGVLNVDVVNYQPAERFGAIVALSTVEHIGWDEEPQDPAKIPLAVQHLRRLLSPTGRMLITCPLSYNPHLDALISADALGADHQVFLLQDRGLWSQVERTTAFAKGPMNRYGGTAVWIAEFSS